MYPFFLTYFPYFRLFRTHTINLVQTERVLLALTLKDIRAPSLGQVRIACILSSTEESFRYNIWNVYFFCRINLTKKFNYLVFKCLPLRSHLNIRTAEIKRWESFAAFVAFSVFLKWTRPSRKHISSRAFVVEIWSADSLYSGKETISRKFNFWYKLYNIQTES